jgi:ankyrin repeat protein
MSMRKLLFQCVLFFYLGLFGASVVFGGAWEDILRAAEANDTETVAGLVARGMDVNTSDRTGTTLLMIAARNGNESLLEFLLRNKANTLKRNKHGDSAILLAAMGGRLAVVKRLVEYGVPVSGDGWSPLEYGAFAGQSEIVGYLLSKGAPIDAKAPNGQTPLMLAAGEGQIAVVKLLITAGADLVATDPEGRTALNIAESREKKEIAEVLRKAMAAK